VLITPTVNGRRPRQSDGFLTPGFCRERSGYNTRRGKKLASFTAGYQLPAPGRGAAGIHEGASDGYQEEVCDNEAGVVWIGARLAVLAVLAQRSMATMPHFGCSCDEKERYS
jgi:hypothetical protein